MEVATDAVYRYIDVRSEERRPSKLKLFFWQLVIVAAAGVKLIEHWRLAPIIVASLVVAFSWLIWRVMDDINHVVILAGPRGFQLEHDRRPRGNYCASPTPLRSFEWDEVKSIRYIERNATWGNNFFEILFLNGSKLHLTTDKNAGSGLYYRPEEAGQPDLIDVIRKHHSGGISTQEDPTINPLGVDIGKYPVFIVITGTLCLLLGIGFISQRHGIHTTDLFWIKPLPVAGLASSIICGPTLVMLRNATAYLVCTIFLTISLTFGMTQYLELKAESKPITTYIPLTYELDDEGFQMWSGSWEGQSVEFGINEKWKGFVPARPNDTRYFPVSVGDFGNLVIQPQPSLAGPPASLRP